MAVDRRVAFVGSAVVIVACAVTVLSQGRGDVADAGTLAGVTAEIRQLRLAVQEATRSQIQAQALGGYLSTQQARVAQANSRLEAVRRQIDELAIQSRETAAQLAEIENMAQSAPASDRAEVEGRVRELKREQERIALEDQQARSREGELAQLAQTEEARWTELVARMEQLIRR